MKTIEDVFIHLLSDTYSAEKQLTRALAKLARATSNEKLSQAFHAHLEETHGQIERIDQVVESESNLKIKRMKCVAMEGLIEEANEVIESTEKNEVRDAALIAAAQKVEHYEIASYGTLATLAEQLGYLGNLLHGEEQFVSADAGYQGAPQREELAEVDVDWLIAERPGKVKTLKQHPRKNKTAINIEYMKASIRAKVEHPFRIIKRQFGFVKARYRGLLKNDNQLAMLFTLANLFRVDQMIRQWERSQ
ncbi:DUF892 family protein [Escherichia coli]